MNQRKPCGKRQRKALILISVLWTLLILLVLALGLDFRTRYFSALARNRLDAEKSVYALQSGLQYSLSFLEQDENAGVDSRQDLFFDNPKDFRECPIDAEKSISISYRDGDKTRFGLLPLNRHLNLNFLTPAQIEKMKNASDFPEEQWAALLDWIDADSDPRNHGPGAEQSFYDNLSTPPLVENKPLTSWDTLYLIKGMDERFATFLREHFTVWGDGKVNLHFADPDTLKWMGFPSSLTEKISRYLTGDDGNPGTEDDRLFSQLINVSLDLNAFDPMFPEENSALTAAIPSLTLASTHFSARIRARIQKRGNPQVLEALIERKEKKAQVLQVREFYE